MRLRGSSQMHTRGFPIFLDTVDRGALSDDSSGAVTLKLPDGRVLDITSEQYVRDWAIPQVPHSRDDRLQPSAASRRRSR